MSRSLARARRERSERVDTRLTGLYESAVDTVPTAAGRTALVAVGGYGRGELSPCSDVDLVLLHTPDLPDSDVGQLAERLWYPLWDDGLTLDHAVRDIWTMREVAGRDWKAALGMLDARHVAGKHTLSRDLRSAVLTDWRRGARQRMPELRAACRRRVERTGDLAHAAVPDLKDCRGGLRDSVVLRALAATGLVDVPDQQAEQQRSALLDVRDAVHEVAARRSDRLHPELVPSVAALLDTDPESLGRHVRGLVRRTAHLLDLTWRRMDQALARPSLRPGLRALESADLSRSRDRVRRLRS